MQPVAVVPCLETAGESFAEKLGVDGFYACEHAREEGLKVELWCDSGYEVGDGHCGTGVGGVEAYAKDDLVVSVEVEALGKDTADL